MFSDPPLRENSPISTFAPEAGGLSPKMASRLARFKDPAFVGSQGGSVLAFAGFQIDLGNEYLLKDGRVVPLRRKPYSILRYLAQNPGRLVTREELVDAVWGHDAMCESLVRTHMRDLRHVLGDAVIETVVGRGYRFTAEVAYVAPATSRQETGQTSVVGRNSQIAELRGALQRAVEQRWGAMFVTGEAGVGKTTLVDNFLRQARARTALHVGWGVCIESHGSGHAYLPVLEALGVLCGAPGRDQVVAVLGKYAPTWLVQMPGLVTDSRLEELQRRAAGGTQARLLSELAAALEVLSAAAPVVLVFEDLQWADPSTTALMAFLCRRRAPARCLILGTFRHSEVPRGHPLSRILGELLAHGEASTIELDGFDAAGLDDYLAERFPGHAFCADLKRSLLRSTGGKPLFITAMVDDLQARGVISRSADVWQLTTGADAIDAYKPDSILRLIEAQVDRLDAAEQRVIEIGGAVGMTFTTSLVAHAMEADPETVESLCDTLAHQRGLLQHLGTETCADGTVHSRYGFGLSLLREVALRRSPSACVRLWRGKIAERLAAYEGRHGEVAPPTRSSWEPRQAATTA